MALSNRLNNDFSPSSGLRAPGSGVGKALTAFFIAISLCTTAHALTDTYHQTFDSMQDGATVNGTDDWTVTEGGNGNATSESGSTATGSGKALKITGVSPAVEVGRNDTFGGLTPTWIEYVVKPGLGADAREVPSTGIGAVTFSSTGKIMAASGDQWVDTGKTFVSANWYRVMMRIDFSAKNYDVYIEPASSPKSPFVADKENLSFIDSTVGSLSRVGMKGAYKMDATADSLVDEVVVHTVDKLQFISSPHTVVRGYSSGMITVQLQNANSEVQTAWKDVTLELRTSTQGGEFSLDKDNWVPIQSITLPEGTQQVSFYYKDFAEGRPVISVNEYPERGWTDATQELKIVNQGEYFEITANPVQTAGEAFTLNIVAKDSEGSPDSTYGGTVDVFLQYVDPQGGSKIVTPETLSGFVNGMLEATVSYPDAGLVKIGVRDQAVYEKVGYSGEILFLPNSFTVTAGASEVVGRPFVVTITARDKNNAVTPNYQGPAVLTAVPVDPLGSDGVLNPAEIPAGSFANGTVDLTTSYNRWGTIGIKVTDSGHPEKMGQTEENLSFGPKAISCTIKKPSATRGFHYAAENVEITVKVLGDDDLPIENYQGTISITPTPAFEIPSTYTFAPSDKGQHTFVVPAGKAGKYTIEMKDVQNNLSVTSEEIEVRDATIVVSNTMAPVGSTVVEIQLVDSTGKRITEESEMTVTILFSEENANGSVFITDLSAPLTFKKGIAKLVVANSEAEVVEFTARSKYGLKVISGKVVFGRAGASGVGALMLRETKE